MKRKRAAAAAMIVLLAGMTVYGIHSLREWIETDQNEGKAILEEELDSSGGDGNTSSENGEPYANEAAEDGETEDQWEKGYDLPISDADRAEAESDCKAVMGSLSYIYQRAAAGVEAGSDVVLPDEILGQMKEVIGKTGVPVLTSESYSAMENYGQMDRFLKDCIEGQEGTAVLYEISSGGSVGRREYTFDGEEMYLLSVDGVWNSSGQPAISYISYSRIRQWDYTEKGWFGYELCVPEPPEVSEIVDGSRLMRVIPMSEENRELSVKYVSAIGYQGNNLLCSNWDEDNMEVLDYNGIYEYLYAVKYGERYDPDEDRTEIPAADFESLITGYLPVTAEQLREWAAYDSDKGTYAWASIVCSYTPSTFSASLPEVTAVRENEDGTLTLTIDAVNEKISYNDAVITHELTICPGEDGSFQYEGNKILDDGIRDIPEYQYRIK